MDKSDNAQKVWTVLFLVLFFGLFVGAVSYGYPEQEAAPEVRIIEVPVPVTTEAFDMRCTMMPEGYTVTRDTIAAGDTRYVVDRLVPLDTIP